MILVLFPVNPDLFRSVDVYKRQIIIILLWFGTLTDSTVQKQIFLFMKFQSAIRGVGICICLLHSCFHFAKLPPGHKPCRDRHDQEAQEQI